MAGRSRRAAASFLAAGVAFGAPRAGGAEEAKAHRLAIQVDQGDPAVMGLALNNVEAAIAYYKERGEAVRVEVVAYGPGLAMLRDDTSPVKDRIREIAEADAPAVASSACGNTKAGMERREGRPIAIVPQATVVPSGVVRLMVELQEQGWSYVRP